MIKKEKKFKTFFSGVAGQSTMEFVLVIPMLIMVTLIVSQLGYLVYLQNIMEHASMEGARILSTTNSNDRALIQVEKICSSLDKERLNTRITPGGKTQRIKGEFVCLKLGYHYGGLGNFLQLVLGREVEINSSCTMRMECGP